MIQRYEASGNGAGQLDEDMQLGESDVDTSAGGNEEYHKSWGHYNPELAATKGGDDRRSFLQAGDTANILYWWHVLDALDLVKMTCVKFNEKFAASSDKKVASVSQNTKRSSQDSSIFVDLSRSMDDYTKTRQADQLLRKKEQIIQQEDQLL